MTGTTTAKKATACDAAKRVLSPEKDAAWLGFMRAHAAVSKSLDADLLHNFGLQLSGFEVLASLEMADGDEGHMRLTDLAKNAGLSQSRISRLVVELERGGLLERVNCPADNRVVWVSITDDGRTLLRQIEDQHFKAIDERFFSNLSASEIKQLASIWPRILESACSGSSSR